jgi:shikimate dehydrogenase
MPAPHAGVLGRPISHSLSPVLHRAAYAALGLEWSYDAIECGVAELRDVLAGRADWAGFSATMPLKRALLDVAAEIRPTAAVVGAANTLLPGPDGWIAENTDVDGIVGALREAHVEPVSVTVLGAGGTAQAAIVALRGFNVERCTVLARNPSRAGLAQAVGERSGVAVSVDRLAPDATTLRADLVVSTLPPGVADVLADREWSADQAVLDVVYSPWPTRLVSAVSAAGGIVLSGALMLLHQAQAQVELMTGRPAPADAMRAALSATAPGCGV